MLRDRGKLIKKGGERMPGGVLLILGGETNYLTNWGGRAHNRKGGPKEIVCSYYFREEIFGRTERRDNNEPRDQFLTLEKKAPFPVCRKGKSQSRGDRGRLSYGDLSNSL